MGLNLWDTVPNVTAMQSSDGLPTSSIMALDALTYPVLAHAPEFHIQPAEPQAPESPDNGNSDSEAVESEIPATSAESATDGTLTEGTGTSAPTPVAAIPDGLGESLFTILVAIPWVLIVLRMQFSPQSRL